MFTPASSHDGSVQHAARQADRDSDRERDDDDRPPRHGRRTAIHDDDGQRGSGGQQHTERRRAESTRERGVLERLLAHDESETAQLDRAVDARLVDGGAASRTRTGGEPGEVWYPAGDVTYAVDELRTSQ